MSDQPGTFDALLGIARIQEKTLCEQKLGRALTEAESLIFDAGFYGGVDFGLKDARRQFDSAVAEYKAGG